MKKDIHPEYREVVFQDVQSDFKFLTRSTMTSDEKIKWEDGKEYPVIKVEVSSASHPFYTGKKLFVDTAGRVERFNQKYKAKQAAAKSPVKEEVTAAEEVKQDATSSAEESKVETTTAEATATEEVKQEASVTDEVKDEAPATDEVKDEAPATDEVKEEAPATDEVKEEASATESKSETEEATEGSDTEDTKEN
jgi:large subunit ribosomal protein L31